VTPQEAETFDLVVSNGTVVIPGVGSSKADVAVKRGKIAAIGEGLAPRGTEVLDASSKHVLPGIFDPHTHIGIERSYEEEAETETGAALIGGVTTIGIFLRSLKDSYNLHLPGFRKAMDELSYVDSVFHPQIFTAEQIEEIPQYARDFGIRSFKFYMSGLPGVVESISDALLLKGFRTVAELGPDTIVCVHCETGSLIDAARVDLKKLPQGNLADWEQAHPPEAEALAIRTASYLAKVAGAHLYVVHLSSVHGLEAVRAARREGAKMTVETVSPYLCLNSDDPNQFLVKMVPPIRSAEHGDAIWTGLLEGSVNTIGTDNTSRTRAAKNPSGGLHGARPGYAVLGTHLPSLLHYGRQRGVSLETLIDPCTRQPAKVYGIYPQKGTIAVGSDADLVVVDLELEKTVTPAMLKGMSDFSPFEGKNLRGWPVATIKGGRIAARDGEIIGPAEGRYLPRPARNEPPALDWLRVVPR
jgi:dihydroorotase-like cyclic amidohydrolase